LLPSPSKSSSRPAASARLSVVQSGTLTVISGCMFSGKTSELIRRIDAAPPTAVAAFKHRVDDRYHASRIVSHAGKSVPAIGVAQAAEILRHVRPRTQFVAIDEGHFFDARLLDAVSRLIDRGIDVTIAALQPDSWGRPFPLVNRLTELADDARTKSATCARCGKNASRTQRLTPIEDGKMVVDPSNYEPRCTNCWTPPPNAARR